MGVQWTGNFVRGTCKLEAHSAISKATKPQSAAHSFEDQVILSAADLISFSSLVACATVGLPADGGVFDIRGELLLLSVLPTLATGRRARVSALPLLRGRGVVFEWSDAFAPPRAQCSRWPLEDRRCNATEPPHCITAWAISSAALKRCSSLVLQHGVLPLPGHRELGRCGMR